ncbi:alpha/beta hydrolase [Methylobacterium sp. BTF04]|uniref:alpha/beta fold hydrolase n=1 Tax=Methylobacterium sp. BTF04 TaxID=2708300 RepID=UPI0013D17F4D|nr:alpha/beta hydrolase [Methylobacterium sp. BTF04]NEU12951.1 alpha/beta hydrolase [Methylobacterium sp. BTF04]
MDTVTDSPEFLTVGTGSETRQIAVRRRAGAHPPLVWLGGFRSDMGASKALALDAWAQANGRALIRFDYTGHGESGGRFADATISTWLADAMAVIATYAPDRPILVGSSMGGWIACLAARHRSVAPSGLVLIAPALDFTQSLMWERFTPDIRATIEREGVWMRPSAYDPEPVPITRALIADGQTHTLLDAPLDPGCPVHILQGMEDPDVPYAHALRIVERLPKAGTVLTLIADGDHRLSRPQDIARLLATVEAMTQTTRADPASTESAP